MSNDVERTRTSLLVEDMGNSLNFTKEFAPSSQAKYLHHYLEKIRAQPLQICSVLGEMTMPPLFHRNQLRLLGSQLQLQMTQVLIAIFLGLAMHAQHPSSRIDRHDRPAKYLEKSQ